MATLQKIVKLTQSQYNTLKNGGTVKGETGLNDEWLYLVPDSSSGGWTYLGDIVTYGGGLDNWDPTFDVTQMQNKMVMFLFSAADKGSQESYGSYIFCMNSIANFVVSVYVPSQEMHGDISIFGLQPAFASTWGFYYLGGVVSFRRGMSSGSFTPNAADTKEWQDFWNNFGLRISVFVQDVNGL